MDRNFPGNSELPELDGWYGDQVISDLLNDMVSGLDIDARQAMPAVYGMAKDVLILSHYGYRFYLTPEEKDFIKQLLYGRVNFRNR